jgi:hypothetical protein
MKLTDTQLHNHCQRLLKKRVNPLLVDSLKRTVLENKAHSKATRAHSKQLRENWRVIMSPLMAEKKAVRSLLLYKNSKSHEQRKEALEGYMVVLETVERRIRDIMQDEVERLVKRRKTQSDPQPKKEWVKRPLTPMQYDNTKTHWVDYVPQHIKDRVCALFDAIPHYPKQKVKHPFPRVMPAEQHIKLKNRLIQRTEKDLRRAKQDALMNPDNENMKALVDKITRALEYIDRLEPNEPVPSTWHGLEM